MLNVGQVLPDKGKLLFNVRQSLTYVNLFLLSAICKAVKIWSFLFYFAGFVRTKKYKRNNIAFAIFL